MTKGSKRNLIGERVGMLTVLETTDRYVSPSGHKLRQWICLCDCGNKVIQTTSSIVTGHAKSCGCSKNKFVGESSKTHGMSKTKIYRVWASMLNRTLNKKDQRYMDYGGRGIDVDPRWKSFELFINDIGMPTFDGLSIDRIDNDKGYWKENVRWATRSEQQANRRKPNKDTQRAYICSAKEI